MAVRLEIWVNTEYCKLWQSVKTCPLHSACQEEEETKKSHITFWECAVVLW